MELAMKEKLEKEQQAFKAAVVKEENKQIMEQKKASNQTTEQSQTETDQKKSNVRTSTELQSMPPMIYQNYPMQMPPPPQRKGSDRKMSL